MSDTNNTLELNEDGTPKEVVTADAPIEGAIPPVADAPLAEPAKPKLTDEEYLADYNERFGTGFKSLEELKPKAAEPTDEEKQKKLSIREKQLLDLHIEKGGTAKDFVKQQGIANADTKGLSYAKTISEYMGMGLTEEEAKQEVKSRYYQLTDEEIEEIEDDTEKEQAKKKRDLFGTRLGARATTDQENSKRYLQQLEQELDEKQSDLDADFKLEAEAEGLQKTFERKMVVGLGDFRGLNTHPVEHIISEADLAEVISVVKNKESREAIFLREDGTDNIPRLTQLLMIEKNYQKIVAKAAAEAANREVEAFEKMATKNPKDLEGQTMHSDKGISVNQIQQIGRKTFP